MTEKELMKKVRAVIKKMSKSDSPTLAASATIVLDELNKK